MRPDLLATLGTAQSSVLTVIDHGRIRSGLLLVVFVPGAQDGPPGPALRVEVHRSQGILAMHLRLLAHRCHPSSSLRGRWSVAADHTRSTGGGRSAHFRTALPAALLQLDLHHGGAYAPPGTHATLSLDLTRSRKERERAHKLIIAVANNRSDPS